VSYRCQALRADDTLCPHTSTNIRNTSFGPKAVCGHHVRSNTRKWGRTFEPECLWPEGLLAAAEIWDQHTQQHLGSAELYATQATRTAAKAAECRLRVEWMREREGREGNGNG
jgi:hypothetical protein